MVVGPGNHSCLVGECCFLSAWGDTGLPPVLPRHLPSSVQFLITHHRRSQLPLLLPRPLPGECSPGSSLGWWGWCPVWGLHRSTTVLLVQCSFSF